MDDALDRLRHHPGFEQGAAQGAVSQLFSRTHTRQPGRKPRVEEIELGSFRQALAEIAKMRRQPQHEVARPQKEDAKVRVIEFTAKKGDKTPMHSHPAYVIYIVKGGKSRFTLADGTTFERDPKDGEAIINPPLTHSEECLADQIAILVELKQ